MSQTSSIMGDGQTIRVAFTGHRSARLSRSDTADLEGRLEAAFSAIEADLDVRPLLVTALADGADQIAARIALDRGWRLEVILPSPLDTFCSSLPASADRQACRDLAARASSLSATGGADNEPDYLQAGLALLDGAAALIAVLDGAPSGGPGGASDLAARADRMGLIVLTVPAGVPY